MRTTQLLTTAGGQEDRCGDPRKVPRGQQDGAGAV